MEFRLLGNIEVRAAGESLELGPPKQRAVLAALLVDAGKPVPTETIVDRVWDDEPPVEAHSALYVHVGRIRRMLARATDPADGGPRLVRAGGGYLLDVEPDRVDWHRFRRLVEAARSPDADDERRAALLGEALALWRGDPLADLSGSWVARIRQGGRQLYLDAVVAWARSQLGLGDPEPVISRVRDLVTDHPLVEPLAAVLMRALYAAGRAAEALERYAALRNRLADELGTDPGPELQQLHREILRGEGAPVLRPAAPPPPNTPAQLPADVAGFAGRDHELAQLDAIVAGGVAVAAISGTAGVGKTALAVHWAHRVREAFPDGQLYVNLRGFGAGREPDERDGERGGQAMAPAEALRGFLGALSVPPPRIPTELDVRAGLYRSLLAGRRMLIVLDNAGDTQQVRPLLPGTPGNFVLVTSRNQLSGLVATEGARPLPLDLLTDGEARDLLAGRLGAARTGAEPAAVDEIVTGCAGLPLALAVVAARAATHPSSPLATLAAELRDSRGLEAFASADSAADIRSVFAWSCRQLTVDAARLFRLLGLHPGPDIGAAAAASLAGAGPTVARRLLSELADAHLLSEHAPGRYLLHDLLRAYAAELTHTEDAGVERRAALRRMLDYYLHTAHAATALAYPRQDTITLPRPRRGAATDRLADHQQALAWFTTERPVLLAAIDQAARAGLGAHAWQLAWSIGLFLHHHGHWRDRVATQRTALAAARRVEDGAGETHTHRGLGQAYVRLGRYADAERHLRRALDRYEGDPHGQGNVQLDLARMWEVQGRYDLALDHSRHALSRYQAAGHRAGQANALNAIGWCHAHLGDHEEALAHCQQALLVQQEIGDRTGQADTWDSIGYAHHRLGRYEEAAASYQYAVGLWHELGSRHHVADALRHLGDTYLAAGRIEETRRTWRHALEMLEDLDHPDADHARADLDRLSAASSGAGPPPLRSAPDGGDAPDLSPGAATAPAG